MYGPALLFAPKGSTSANLVGTGQVTDPRVYFCPAQTDVNFMWSGNNDKSGTWLTSLGAMTATGNPHMGYLYAPHGATTSHYKYPYMKLSKTPKNISIVTELIGGSANIAHLNSKSTGTFNLAFGDGHVDAVTSTYAVTQLHVLDSSTVTQDIAGSGGGAAPDGHNGAAIWPFFKKITDELEQRSGN